MLSSTSAPLVDQLSRQCVAARDACAANALARAHQSILASIRKEVASRIPAQRQWLQKRVQDICEGRMQLLATVKSIRETLVGGGAARRRGDEATGSGASHPTSSFASMFEHETPHHSTPPSSSLASLDGVHAAIAQRLKAVDALCFVALPPLGYQVGAETFQLFTTVMSPEGTLDETDGNDSEDSASSADGNDEGRRAQKPPSTLLPPLQRLAEDAYLRSVVLPPLTVELLAEALEDDGAVQISEQLGGPSASPSTELESYLTAVCDRLALRAALDDIRGESKLCKRQPAAAAPTSAYGEGSSCPPAVSIASPDALPYCVSIVYGIAAQAAIAAHGVGATLDVVKRWCSDDAASCGEGLDRVVLQFLLHVVFEPEHKKLRCGTVNDEELASLEGRDVRERMRELRGILRHHV